MKTILVTAALAVAANAAMLALGVTKQAPRSGVSAQRQRRHHWQRDDSHVATTQLEDAGYRYFVDVDIGTPPQTIALTIDTGSSAMWTITKQSGVCKNSTFKCYTPFDLVASKTLTRLNVSGPYDDYNLPFKVAYADGSVSANGTYYTDTVSIAGETIKEMPFGAANQSSFTNGIIGLAFSRKDDGNASETDPLYNHGIVDSLVGAGAINRRLFSLALGHTDEANGTLVFGGVDSARYYDDLVSVPMVPNGGADTAVEYAVKMQGLEIKGLDGVNGTSGVVTVVLDNGSPQNYLPKDMVQPLTDKFGAQSINSDQGLVQGLVDCAMGRKYSDARIGFQFAGKTIYITGADAVRDIFPPSQQRQYRQKIGPKADGWDGLCMFAFVARPEGISSNLVGDPMLRHTYAVYDIDNKVIGLAQANIGSTKNNLVEVGKDDKIPSTKGAPAPKSISEPGATDKGNQDSQPKGTGTGDSGNGTSGNGTDKGSGGNDKKDAAGILGAPLTTVLLAAGGAVGMLML